ncbi:15551_t:CDS:2, partial [Dentiscutata erythropus]
ELSDYKHKVENSKKRKLEKINPKTNQIFKKFHTTVESDNGIETDYELDPQLDYVSDPQIESSTTQQNNYSENFSKLESEFSELHSDDLSYTKRQKKGKSKVINQATIQINHQEFLNNNSKRIYESDKYLISKNKFYEDNSDGELDYNSDSSSAKKAKMI